MGDWRSYLGQETMHLDPGTNFVKCWFTVVYIFLILWILCFEIKQIVPKH